MTCPRHGTACLTEATRVCFYELIAAAPDGMSQEEIAPHLGIDNSRVGQVERIAIKKVKRAIARRGLELKAFVDPFGPAFGMPVRRYGAAQ